MVSDLPSFLTLIALELSVVALTALATWRFAVHHFRSSQPARDLHDAHPRLERLEEALDDVGREVERLGESQDFVQELLANRLERLGLRPGKSAPGHQSKHPTPV